ncbi:cell division protein FtsZ [Pantoea osteomyelitidis]|uniref:Cell division protein FtsZ n=1 Tax=Pantoea osteomyelitidis TaxID=3230026 RepID=A0ABW7PW37_9GAMM
MKATTVIPRSEIKPGMLVEYRGKLWRASVNSNKGLYLHRPHEQIRCTDTHAEVYKSILTGSVIQTN